VTNETDAAGFPELPHAYPVTVEMLLVSPRHRYEGRPADGAAPVLPGQQDELRDRVELRAGLGIVGDRYFAARAHVHATVTVIDCDALDRIGAELGVDLRYAATRRNVFLRGVPVDELRSTAFSLDTGDGAVRFRGYRPANPCAWMDHEVAAGAFRAMRGHGGVRCDPESDGVLTLGAGVLRTERPLPGVR
jgi:hypothetical protein